MQHNNNQTDDISDIVHSSGYAREQNPGIGATSDETFEQRLEVDRHRETIARYKGIQAMHARKRAQAIQRMSFRRSPVRERAAPSETPSPETSRPDTPAKHSFKEPPSRGYNPYV